MKQRQPIRKISLKRLKQLSGNGISLFHNSTIRRKLCNATTAEPKSSLTNTETSKKVEYGLTPTDSYSARSIHWPNRFQRKPAKRNSSANFGKQRNPVNKQSAKQKARLQRLAAIRKKWWDQHLQTGNPVLCGICDEEISTREELASDHKIPGTFRDHSESNLQPAHNICNEIKGSRRNFKIVRGDRNWKLIHGLL